MLVLSVLCFFLYSLILNNNTDSSPRGQKKIKHSIFSFCTGKQSFIERAITSLPSLTWYGYCTSNRMKCHTELLKTPCLLSQCCSWLHSLTSISRHINSSQKDKNIASAVLIVPRDSWCSEANHKAVLWICQDTASSVQQHREESINSHLRTLRAKQPFLNLDWKLHPRRNVPNVSSFLLIEGQQPAGGAGKGAAGRGWSWHHIASTCAHWALCNIL